MTILEVTNLTKRFGGLVALNDVSFSIDDGSIFGLVGPNGSGKSVLFNTIAGFYKNDGGEVVFKGERITNKPAHIIASHGLGRSFQGSRTFSSLTVKENVRVGQHTRYKQAIHQRVINKKRGREHSSSAANDVEEILDLLGLSALSDITVKELNHVTRSLVGIAVALAIRPRLLLLDEPIAGMNPTEATAAIEIIQKIAERGVTIFMVEHHMKAVMNVCGRIMVLNHGEKIAEGTPWEISRNDEVVEAYLGRGFRAASSEA